MPASFARRHGLALAGCLTCLVVLGLLCFLVVLKGQVGPLDSADPGWHVFVNNDTGQSVHVSETGEDLVLDPGEIQRFPAPGPGQLTFVMTISTKAGQTIGCLPVILNTQASVITHVSAATACPTLAPANQAPNRDPHS